MNGDPRISVRARAAVGVPSAEIFVSAASAWELAVKVRLGKLPEASRLTHRLAESLAEQGFKSLPIGLEHGRLSGLLPGAHRDPFDRMLAAQALLEDLVLVTNDAALPSFGVKTLW
ncbi:MAG TPA: type II toxin-antitoxin system VapC family toxin [Hyphomicrobiaceae bacterium]|jgi:PIN domain nuclease of toxin-antitoxin system